MNSPIRVVIASLALVSSLVAAHSAQAAPRTFLFKGQFAPRAKANDACDALSGQAFTGMYSFDETATETATKAGTYAFSGAPAGMGFVLGERLSAPEQTYAGEDLVIGAVPGEGYRATGWGISRGHRWYGFVSTNAMLPSDALPLVPPTLGNQNRFSVKFGVAGDTTPCEAVATLTLLAGCPMCELENAMNKLLTLALGAEVTTQLESAVATTGRLTSDYQRLIDVVEAAQSTPHSGVFLGTNSQFTARLGGDFAPNMWKAECGPTEALVGLSVRPSDGYGYSALCSSRSARIFHEKSACRAVALPAADGPVASNSEPGVDWNKFFWKYQCNANEQMAGIAQITSDYKIRALLCCPGAVEVSTPCTTSIVGSGDYGGYGDWAPYYPKATCPAGAFVRGVSRKSNGRLHAVRCCKAPSALAPRPQRGTR